MIGEAERFGIEFDPEYIMQDACDASANTARRLFPEVKILMCYFHVKKNVKENVASDNLLPKEKRDELRDDLTDIHMSHNPEDYRDNIEKFKTKYYKRHRACYDYCASWFYGPWSNWQIYHNKPGQANTNSNIESFNNVIKKKYTNRRKLRLKAALIAIGKLILSYSTEPLDFEIYPKFCKKTKSSADKLGERNFKKIGKNKYKYESLITDNSSIIMTNCPQCHNTCSCTCKTFVKDGVCLHVVALSSLHNLNLFQPKYEAKSAKNFFVDKVKRGPKHKLNSKKDYGKALDKPLASTPKSSPVAKAKPKPKKVKLDVPVRKSGRTVVKK